jgi:hypothetical protein
LTDGIVAGTKTLSAAYKQVHPATKKSEPEPEEIVDVGAVAAAASVGGEDEALAEQTPEEQPRARQSVPMPRPNRAERGRSAASYPRSLAMPIAEPTDAQLPPAPGIGPSNYTINVNITVHGPAETGAKRDTATVDTSGGHLSPGVVW